MKKFLPDLIAILAFIILSFAYFFPADIEGRILFQHDTAAGVDETEVAAFDAVLEELEKMSVNIQSLMLWAQKNRDILKNKNQ